MFNYKDRHNLTFNKKFYKQNHETFGVEIKLISDFNLIKETLERIGVINRNKKIITPSCYIIMRNKKYYICHFKELLAFEGFKNHTQEIDYVRRNRIVTMLEEWNHCTVVDRNFIFKKSDNDKIKIMILSHKDKNNYEINHKYDYKPNSYDSLKVN